MSYLLSNQMIHICTTAICCCCAFLLTGFFFWSLWNTAQTGFQHLRRLHQIPCSRCQYFTGEYLLKCTVHPSKAFSEEAIDCFDYQAMAQWNCRFCSSACHPAKRSPLTRFTQGI